MADITNGHDFDKLSGKSDREGITYFMGAVSQALKEGNKVMTNMESKMENISTSVNTLNNKMLLTNQESTLKREECKKKFETVEKDVKDVKDRTSRDYKRLNDLETTSDVDKKSVEKSKSWVAWIVAVGMFVLAMVNTFKEPQEKVIVMDKKSIEQLKVELKK